MFRHTVPQALQCWGVDVGRLSLLLSELPEACGWLLLKKRLLSYLNLEHVCQGNLCYRLFLCISKHFILKHLYLLLNKKYYYYYYCCCCCCLYPAQFCSFCNFCSNALAIYPPTYLRSTCVDSLCNNGRGEKG